MSTIKKIREVLHLIENADYAQACKIAIDNNFDEILLANNTKQIARMEKRERLARRAFVMRVKELFKFNAQPKTMFAKWVRTIRIIHKKPVRKMLAMAAPRAWAWYIENPHNENHDEFEAHLGDMCNEARKSCTKEQAKKIIYQLADLADDRKRHGVFGYGVMLALQREMQKARDPEGYAAREKSIVDWIEAESKALQEASPLPPLLPE